MFGQDWSIFAEIRKKNKNFKNLPNMTFYGQTWLDLA